MARREDCGGGRELVLLLGERRLFNGGVVDNTLCPYLAEE